MTTATTATGRTFDVCDDCGHWAKRWVDGCGCGCHPEGRGGDE